MRFDALKSIGEGPVERDVRAAVVRIGLNDKLGYNRLQAVRALRPLWPEADVVRVFSSRLRDEQFVVEGVLAILGEVGGEQAHAMLAAAFSNGHETWLKVAVLAGLQGASEQFVFDFLAKSNVLNHRDEKVRAAVVSLLGSFRNATMRNIFRQKLKDPDARVRANAIEALAGIMDGVELARIVAPYAVADTSNRVRANSLILLAKAGISKAADFIAQMARHSDPRWRASAAYAMRHVPPEPKLAPWARKLAQDEDEMVVGQAELALARFA